VTDYEKIYQKEANACGEPFIEFIDFFEHLNDSNLRVLDLACGQGRDAIFIAEKGHFVLGIDLSKTGIQQIPQQAKKNNLNIIGKVADALNFVPQEKFDIIVIDRLLHMFKSDMERQSVLENMRFAVKNNGFILIADTPKNKPFIAKFFDSNQWTTVLDKTNFTFVRKLSKT
jgi:2-polyprenyl-3-methyl-5-hydroxy-6-metoxy-1,4-benzoquinol methylase